jgi:hypothetical protein
VGFSAVQVGIPALQRLGAVRLQRAGCRGSVISHGKSSLSGR